MNAERQDLIAAVVVIQNHPFFQSQDILTFCGFCTNDEIRKHIEACLSTIALDGIAKAAA